MREGAEAAGRALLAQLHQRARLDLADALARHAEDLADLLQRVREDDRMMAEVAAAFADG